MEWAQGHGPESAGQDRRVGLGLWVARGSRGETVVGLELGPVSVTRALPR